MFFSSLFFEELSVDSDDEQLLNVLMSTKKARLLNKIVFIQEELMNMGNAISRHGRQSWCSHIPGWVVGEQR